MANLKHGMSRTSTYGIWAGMIARCHRNDGSEHYARYGARGIAVCDRWRYSFENFYADMGERPDGMSIERKDNAKGYEPLNCVWATAKEQQRNRRGVLSLTVGGVTKTLPEWCEETGMHPQTVRDRVKAGWTHESALNTPVGHARLGPPNKHGLPGVVISGKRWGACLSHRGQRYWIGTFDSKEAAYAARVEKTRELKKERA